MPATPSITDDDLAVRNFIEAELKRRKETKAALGRVVGLTPYQLNRRFWGGYPFQLAEVRRIADHWEITVQDILDGPTQGE